MRIVTVSDIHAEFDRFTPALAPSGDCCVMAGDLTDVGRGLRARQFSRQAERDLLSAENWLRLMAQRMPLFWIPGNHDIGVDRNTFPAIDDCRYVEQADTNWSGLTIAGVSMAPCYDLPVLATIWDYSTTNPLLEAAAYECLPNADVVVSHCPPLGFLDDAYNPEVQEIRSIGSRALLDYIDRVQPMVVVCGHAHDNIGIKWRDGTAVIKVDPVVKTAKRLV